MSAAYHSELSSETFADLGRYHYLLQSDPDLISLDDYVLNTGMSLPPDY